MIPEYGPPTNIDFDQLSRFGQKNDDDCLAIKIDFEDQIFSIHEILNVDKFNGASSAIRLLCDIITDMKKKIDELENRQKCQDQERNFPEFH